MEEKVKVTVIVYGHIKEACGFESKTILVPPECTEAFRFVLAWFRDNYGISCLLMYNNKSASGKAWAGQKVKNGDIFKLMSRQSGG